MNLKEISTFDEFKDTIAPIIIDLVKDVFKGVKDDVEDLGKDLAYRFAVSMWIAKTGTGFDKETALRNLEHLEAQVDQLKTIHRLRVRRAASEALSKVVTASFKFLLNFL